MDKLVRNFYRLLMLLSGISMLAAFAAVTLGVFAREVAHLNIDGLDAYAGYAIAAALFFALPSTLQNGDHIRVTLVLDRLPARLRSAFKAWWRGVKLLCRRPLAVLSAYLVPTVCSLLLALLVVVLRQRIDASGLGGFLLAMLLGCAIAGTLAWGKIARLFALRALAEDAHARR